MNKKRTKMNPEKSKVRRRYRTSGFLMLIVASFVAFFHFCFSNSAPEFELDTARHGKVRLSELKGTNVVLIFFRSTG
jgi:hypothetical protein